MTSTSTSSSSPSSLSDSSSASSHEYISSFFSSTSPPPSLSHLSSSLHSFLSSLPPSVTRLVFLTSGGTTVPLEQRMVRFIDNFSTGARGSHSAETFLKENQRNKDENQSDIHYGVIMMARKNSILPGRRAMQRNISALNTMEISTSSSSSSIYFSPSSLSSDDVNNFHLVKSSMENKIYFEYFFESVVEYLFYYREILTSIRDFHSTHAHYTISPSSVIVYNCAAVSDYYIPSSLLSTNKIPSSSSTLTLSLLGVPKVLPLATSQWLPSAYHLSFKLETDESVLIEKAKRAIEMYGVNGVIANELSSRYDKVWIVEGEKVEGEGKGKEMKVNLEVIQRPKPKNENPHENQNKYSDDGIIEQLFISKIIDKHTKHIEILEKRIKREIVRRRK